MKNNTSVHSSGRQLIKHSFTQSHPGLRVNGAERNLHRAQPVLLHPRVDGLPFVFVILRSRKVFDKRQRTIQGILCDKETVWDSPPQFQRWLHQICWWRLHLWLTAGWRRCSHRLERCRVEDQHLIQLFMRGKYKQETQSLNFRTYLF